VASGAIDANVKRTLLASLRATPAPAATNGRTRAVPRSSAPITSADRDETRARTGCGNATPVKFAFARRFRSGRDASSSSTRERGEERPPATRYSGESPNAPRAKNPQPNSAGGCVELQSRSCSVVVLPRRNPPPALMYGDAANTFVLT